MEFDKVVKKRKMIRRYERSKPIPKPIIDKLIENAHRAPSAGHTQVQEFVIVTDPSVKSKLAEAALGQDQVKEASTLIVVCSNFSRSLSRYGNRGKEFYSIIDGAFSSMLILLSSVNEGLGACFVGAFQDNKIAKILNLPNHVKPIGIVTLGYPAEKPGRFERMDISKLVYYERYGRNKH